MGTSKEFADYVCDQLMVAGNISCKKMFGEYGVYLDEKIVGLICDNQFFLKKTEAGTAHHRRFENLIKAMVISKVLIEDQLNQNRSKLKDAGNLHK